MFKRSILALSLVAAHRVWCVTYADHRTDCEDAISSDTHHGLTPIRDGSTISKKHALYLDKDFKENAAQNIASLTDASIGSAVDANHRKDPQSTIGHIVERVTIRTENTSRAITEVELNGCPALLDCISVRPIDGTIAHTKVPEHSNQLQHVMERTFDATIDDGTNQRLTPASQLDMVSSARIVIGLLGATAGALTGVLLLLNVVSAFATGLSACEAKSKKDSQKRARRTMRRTTIGKRYFAFLLSSFMVRRALGFQISNPLRHSAAKALGENDWLRKPQVACDAVMASLEDGEARRKSARPSRSERKAMERAQKARRKNAGHRKHNFAERKNELRGRKPGEGPLQLHSTVIPELNQNSTADEVMRAIKRAQNLHDRHDLKAISRFLLEHTDDSFAYGYKGSMLARLAVAALHINSHSIAKVAIDYRRANFRSSMLPMESAAIVRNLLRVHNVTAAWNILEDELSLPLEGTKLTSSRSQDRLVHRANALASIASRHFFEGEAKAGVHACNTLAGMGPIMKEAEVTGERLGLPWPRILQGAARCQTLLRNGTISVDVEPSEGPVEDIQNTHVPCNIVYSVLNSMINLPSENDNRAYERLSNALVRRVVFVTGAVAMDRCPPPDRGEAAFIGRSNVGKSSLVNMVTNRKSLAYTSKRPGKTQQFNFFAVNDKPGLERQIRYGDDIPGEKDDDSFYIVDLPGFGYAKVPDKQRREWASFMGDYISGRPNLRVLFHLVDSRHGATEEDELIMQQVSRNLPEYARYVIVLTKADKNVKGPNNKFTGKVTSQVMDQLQNSMNENLSVHHEVPVILTSAETRLGRDEMWRYLCRAATY